MELKKRLAAGEDLPFDQIISSNIGNPQALGQKPVTMRSLFARVSSDFPSCRQAQDLVLMQCFVASSLLESGRVTRIPN